MFNKEYVFNQCCRIHSVQVAQLQSELQVELWVGAARGKRLWTANPWDNLVTWGPARWSLRETKMTPDFGALRLWVYKSPEIPLFRVPPQRETFSDHVRVVSVAAKGPLPSLGAATVTGSWMVRQKGFLHSQLKTEVWQIECLNSKAEVFQASLQNFFSHLKNQLYFLNNCRFCGKFQKRKETDLVSKDF